MKLLYRYVRNYWPIVALALMLATINQVFSLLDPLIFRYVIDNYATRFQEYTTSQFFQGVSLLLAAAVGVAFISRRHAPRHAGITAALKAMRISSVADAISVVVSLTVIPNTSDSNTRADIRAAGIARATPAPVRVREVPIRAQPQLAVGIWVQGIAIGEEVVVAIHPGARVDRLVFRGLMFTAYSVISSPRSRLAVRPVRKTPRLADAFVHSH